MKKEVKKTATLSKEEMLKIKAGNDTTTKVRNKKEMASAVTRNLL